MNIEERARVLLLSQAPGVGGGERLTIPSLARSSALEMTVVAPQPVCQYAEDLGLATVALQLPRVHRLYHALPLVAGSVKIRGLTRSLEADVLYANGTRAMPYALGARVLGVPPLVAHHVGLFTLGPVRSLVRGLERWADAIIVISEAAARPFRKSRKLRVVPSGIDLEHFRPPADRAWAKRALGLPEDGPVVGALTRADPTKGMTAFLNVAKKVSDDMPGVRFLLAGGAAFPHEKAHYGRVRREASGLLGDRVLLTGYLEDSLVAFRAMDVFVHLSEPEGFPTTAIEAMACAVPVVAYGWGGVTEIVEHEVTGLLVTPRSEDDAAAAIRRLVVDEDFRSNAGTLGRARCEERFDIRRFINEVTAIVLSVAGR